MEKHGINIEEITLNILYQDRISEVKTEVIRHSCHMFVDRHFKVEVPLGS